uniref:Uncharacterized protein n=1 Tax=viral metagenome TaxID=1070528 RepID=A0A6C0KS16_9ZZZZ
MHIMSYFYIQAINLQKEVMQKFMKLLYDGTINLAVFGH